MKITLHETTAARKPAFERDSGIDPSARAEQPRLARFRPRQWLQRPPPIEANAAYAMGRGSQNARAWTYAAFKS